MEGIRSIAIAYHDRATRGEKDLIQQYFNKFNIGRKGKITLQQFKNGVPKHLSDERIFRKLDANGDGTLDFDEIVCLYYIEKKLGLHKCAAPACQDLLVGAYFSCLLCVEDGLGSECRLCCTCYHLGDFSHNHSLANFLDQYSMAKVLKNHIPDARKDRGKKELEDLRQIAKSYYLAASEEVQKLAHEFFNSMDMDGDGKIDLSEFLEFMKEEGYGPMQNPKFFTELDFDGNGTLDFDEVMTAYYITKSGRPFCDECGDFIRGIFFSCVACYPKDAFNLCSDCYRSKKCDHKHDGRAQFLDNFALLEAMKDSSGKDSLGETSSQEKISDLQNQARSPVPAKATRNPIPSTKKQRAPVPSQEKISDQQNQARSPVPAKATRNPTPYTQTRGAPEPSHTTTVPAVNHTTIVTNTYVLNPTPAVSAYYNRNRRWGVALKALEAALAIGTVASTVAACTIM